MVHTTTQLWVPLDPMTILSKVLQRSPWQKVLLAGLHLRHPCNEVPTKPTHGILTQVHPSMLDHSYNSCNWENFTAGTEESGHYETSLHWKHAGRLYYNMSDCQLLGEGAAKDRVLKDAKAQVGTTHQPPPQYPPSGSSIAADSACANTPVATEKTR